MNVIGSYGEHGKESHTTISTEDPQNIPYLYHNDDSDLVCSQQIYIHAMNLKKNYWQHGDTEACI